MLALRRSIVTEADKVRAKWVHAETGAVRGKSTLTNALSAVSEDMQCVKPLLGPTAQEVKSQSELTIAARCTERATRQIETLQRDVDRLTTIVTEMAQDMRIIKHRSVDNAEGNSLTPTSQTVSEGSKSKKIVTSKAAYAPRAGGHEGHCRKAGAPRRVASATRPPEWVAIASSCPPFQSASGMPPSKPNYYC